MRFLLIASIALFLFTDLSQASRNDASSSRKLVKGAKRGTDEQLRRRQQEAKSEKKSSKSAKAPGTTTSSGTITSRTQSKTGASGSGQFSWGEAVATSKKGSKKGQTTGASKNDENNSQSGGGTTGREIDLGNDQSGNPNAMLLERTVQIQPLADRTKCVAYFEPEDDEGADNADMWPVELVDCGMHGMNTHWEVLRVTDTTFVLRHKQYQKCIPQDPEVPGRNFNCWSGRANVAVADSINGLIPCDSTAVALLSLTESLQNMYVYNTACTDATSKVAMMAYLHSDNSAVLWGQETLMSMTDLTNTNGRVLIADWRLMTVPL